MHKEYFEKHTEAQLISFEQQEMCAMDGAFSDPANANALEDFRALYPDAYTSRQSEYFKGATSVSVSFEKFKEILLAAAKVFEAEQSVLEQKNGVELLICGHHVTEHVQALESALFKIEKSFTQTAN